MTELGWIGLEWTRLAKDLKVANVFGHWLGRDLVGRDLECRELEGNVGENFCTHLTLWAIVAMWAVFERMGMAERFGLEDIAMGDLDHQA